MTGALHFDIDASQLAIVAAELQATPKQVHLAFSAALKRTATTLRTQAARGMASELQLRTINLLRQRLKAMKLRGKGDTMQLWFGINDMPTSWFKGTPKQGTDGSTARGQFFAGAFVAKSKFKGRATVFKRQGSARLHIVEQNLAVSDQAMVFIEDTILEQAGEIFWKYFSRDLKARVKFNIGER